MKKVKIAFWIILIGFLGLLFYQNQDYFLSKHILRLDLMSTNYQTPELPNAVFLIGFLVIGLLIAYIFSLIDRFKANKTAKFQQSTIDSQQSAIGEMQKEVQKLKEARETSQEPEPVTGLEAEPAETETTQTTQA